jgi:hypothetical protein
MRPDCQIVHGHACSCYKSCCALIRAEMPTVAAAAMPCSLLISGQLQRTSPPEVIWALAALHGIAGSDLQQWQQQQQRDV